MSTKKAAAKTAATAEVGNVETDFEREYDKDFKIPNAIREALKSLGNGWLKNADFSRKFNIGQNDLSVYAGQFSAHIVIIPGEKTKVWWGNPVLAEKWRKKLGTRPIG